VAPIVMGVVYFAVFTPMGLIARLLGKDFLRLRRDPAAPTQAAARPGPGPAPRPGCLRDQF
jgi:hypothetical protein